MSAEIVFNQVILSLAQVASSQLSDAMYDGLASMYVEKHQQILLNATYETYIGRFVQAQRLSVILACLLLLRF